MLIIDFIKKILGKQETSNVDSSLENSVIDMSYEFNHHTGELLVYLYFDLDLNINEITVVPVNNYELAIVSKEKGVIGLLKIKKKYYKNSIEIDRKQKTLKIKILLKK